MNNLNKFELSLIIFVANVNKFYSASRSTSLFNCIYHSKKYISIYINLFSRCSMCKTSFHFIQFSFFIISKFYIFEKRKFFVLKLLHNLLHCLFQQIDLNKEEDNLLYFNYIPNSFKLFIDREKQKNVLFFFIIKNKHAI